MKISKIKISKFHQFEDFELDLTYPKGHEKEGKPLDKVCFIGQSGTGKTTLLEMVCHACAPHSTPRFSDLENHSFNSDFMSFANITFRKEDDSKNQLDVYIDSTGVNKNKIVESIANSVLYFSIGLSQANLEKRSMFLDKDEVTKDSVRAIVSYGKQLTYYPISGESLYSIWNDFYQFIKRYQHEEASFRISLTHRYEKEKIDIGRELENWKNQHQNPIVLVANECLNPILKRFNLRVKTTIDDIRLLDTLQISNLNEDKTIPYESLSTGTKQIIFTAFPIYQLLEDDSIVLMDEPETSLYPDIQREIIPYYTSFDKNKTSQFFFATHSPIIASAFEPWEIVELKFDEKGKVYRENYYPKDEENHVDNYKIDPRYLRWDDILTKVFDLPFDSNADFRASKLTEYTVLKNKIKILREEGKLNNPTKETQQIIEDFQKAETLLTGSWEYRRHEKN